MIAARLVSPLAGRYAAPMPSQAFSIALKGMLARQQRRRETLWREIVVQEQAADRALGSVAMMYAWIYKQPLPASLRRHMKEHLRQSGAFAWLGSAPLQPSAMLAPRERAQVKTRKPSERRETDEDRAPALIKRYAGRRFYNIATACYVTLDELARLRADGRQFIVRDAKTHDDITDIVLCQRR